MSTHKRSLLSVAGCVALLLLAVGWTAALAFPPGPDNQLAGAPHAAIDAPTVRIKRVTNTNNVNLSWSHMDGTDAYEIYRSTQAYPEPGVAPAARIYDLPASAYGQGSKVEYVDDGVDRYPGDGTLATVQVVGVPSVNYYWVVQGHTASMDVSGPSNLVGEFDFALVKGS